MTETENTIEKVKEDLSLLKLTLNAIKNDPSVLEWISVLFIYQDLIQSCEKSLAIFDNSISNVKHISKIVQGMIDTCLEIMLNCKNDDYRQDCLPYTEIQRKKVLDSLIKSHKREEKIRTLRSSPDSINGEAGINNTNSSTLNRSFSTKEAAHYINMSVAFLSKARSDGNIGKSTSGPPYLKLGKTVRYLKMDLDKWLEELSNKNR